MNNPRITIDQGAIDRLAHDASGEIARALFFEAHNTVFWIVKDTLNKLASFTVGRNKRIIWQANPPVGPPLQRTGRLWSSVAVGRPARDAQGVHVDILVHSIPRTRMDPKGNVSFDTHDYVKQLIERGYIFVPRNDPRFVILPRGPGQ